MMPFVGPPVSPPLLLAGTYSALLFRSNDCVNFLLFLLPNFVRLLLLLLRRQRRVFAHCCNL
jgi:hypothetical protein